MCIEIDCAYRIFVKHCLHIGFFSSKSGEFQTVELIIEG